MTQHSELPAPLKYLQQTPPGMLYMLAGKAHIIDATRLCDRTVAAVAVWNHDKTALTVTCVDGAQVELSADGQLSYHCNCWHWTRNSQCPHLVTLWIQLKRLVSPNSFPHLSIRSGILQGLADLIGLPSPELPLQEQLHPNPRFSNLMKRYGLTTASRLPATRSLKQEQPTTTGQPARLVLEESYGRLRGSVYYGSVQVQRWTAGIPGELQTIVQRMPAYESSLRYLSAFMTLTAGRYPMVYRDQSGTETVLKLMADTPRRACLSFNLVNRQVTIARTVDGATPLPVGTIFAGELLLNLPEAAIYPLAAREVWSIWNSIRDQLLTTGEYDGRETGRDGDGLQDENSAQKRDSGENQGEGAEDAERRAHSITVSAARFNAISLRLNPNALPDFHQAVLFLQGSSEIPAVPDTQPVYLLGLPAQLDSGIITMSPSIGCDQHLFPFSGDLFRFFDPIYRSGLSGPLKAKKRVRGMMECCFALADATSASARRSVIKDALSGPDYFKRTLKSEARKVLNAFAEECIQRPLMIQATEAGWRFAADDRSAQVRMARILYEQFGPEGFDVWDRPLEFAAPQADLLEALPQLAGLFQQGGFSLRLGNQPLAEAVWDFTLDATASTMDWFELRPEIRCDGELLTPEELQRLATGGILQRDGRIVLIDDISARILAMLSGTLAPGSRKKKTEQQIVRIPRLQILDWLQLRSHGVTVRLAPDDAHVLESLLNFAAIDARPLPHCLDATLRPYQQDGYQWLGFLYEHRFGACLADDMGLGKTVQAISLLAGIADGRVKTMAAAGTPHLIVVPPSLLFNWESEIARFFPSATVTVYSGQKRSTADFNHFDIILTSYGIIQRDIEQLATLRFNVIIYDEAQTVKNLQAATTGAARRLVGSFKLALTGTPVENRVEEYYAIMDLCLPGLLGTPEQFGRSIGNRAQGGIETLLRRTRPFILRRNKQLIAADLPDKIESDIQLELSPKQRVLYQRTVEEVRSQVAEAYANRAAGQARIIALTAILRLRQICLAPSLALPGSSDVSPKLDFLIEQLQELRDEGHSVLVFSQFTSYLDIVEAGLRHHHLVYLRLDGSTPVAQRKALVQGFQNSVAPTVFLISLKAGGKGLNLTRATYVYHLDPWWNPAVENQASDRAHRIGQTRQVTITRLIMRHTIEEKMMTLKEQKLKLYRALLDTGTAEGGAGLTREDFDFLLA